MKSMCSMKFNNQNIFIGENVTIGENVKIGDNVRIYDNVTIGDNCTICNDCVIGEPLADFYRNDNYKNPTLKIGANSLVRSHSIIYAGSSFGQGFSCGHRVTIREFTKAGDNFSVGTLSDLQGFVEIGDYCRLHSNVHIGQKSKIGNFVFIYPYVVFTNDPHPPSNICQGPTVGDYTQIAVHSVLLPGIKIGRHCLVGANSTVGKDFGDEKVIVGAPAKVVCHVHDIKSRTNPKASHYPWMYNFERGMPWEGVGYDFWVKQQK